MSQAAAAVYVITQQDIARSGATSIPELLRMAPGAVGALHDQVVDALQVSWIADNRQARASHVARKSQANSIRLDHNRG